MLINIESEVEYLPSSLFGLSNGKINAVYGKIRIWPINDHVCCWWRFSISCTI